MGLVGQARERWCVPVRQCQWLCPIRQAPDYFGSPTWSDARVPWRREPTLGLCAQQYRSRLSPRCKRPDSPPERLTLGTRRAGPLSKRGFLPSTDRDVGAGQRHRLALSSTSLSMVDESHATVPRAASPRAFSRILPAHVTLRLRPGLTSLRTLGVVREIEHTFARGCERSTFRLVHYSLQGNHAHLIVEASDREPSDAG